MDVRGGLVAVPDGLDVADDAFADFRKALELVDDYGYFLLTAENHYLFHQWRERRDVAVDMKPQDVFGLPLNSAHCICSAFLPMKKYKYFLSLNASVINVVLPVRLRPINTVNCDVCAARSSSLLSSAISVSRS